MSRPGPTISEQMSEARRRLALIRLAITGFAITCGPGATQEDSFYALIAAVEELGEHLRTTHIRLEQIPEGRT
jgi:hypothetical protein